MREYKFNEARSNQALEGIYSTVVLRDILQRNNGADQSMLQKIMLFCVLILVALLLRIVSEMYFPMKAIFRLENQRILQEKLWINISLCYEMHLYFSLLGDMM